MHKTNFVKHGALILFFLLFNPCVMASAAPLPDAAPQPPAAAPQPAEPPHPNSPLEQLSPLPRISPTLPRDIAIAPMETELSGNAQEIYAYLLFIQAILDEDEAALLDVAPLLSKGNAPASIWLDGGVWLMSRKSPNSVVFLEEALKNQPDDLSLNLLYAESLGDHGMAGRGVENMQRFMATHPDSLDAKLELALLLVKDKQFEDAQKLLNSITAKQRTPLVDYYQAKALLGMDRPQEAIPYLRRAVKGMPDFVEALAELAFAHEQEGNLREARNTYEKLKKLNFSPQDVSLRLINLSLRLKQPNQALQYIKQGPDTLPFKLTAANMLMEARHYLQAESILKQIAASDRAPVEVYLLLADLAFEHRRNLPVALSWLDRIPDAGTSGARVELLRAQLMAEAGKSEDALRTVEKAIAAYPDTPELRDMEVRLLAKDKKTAEALAKAAEAHQKWPDNAQIAFLYGSLLDESGDKAKALEIMEDLLKKQPDNYQAMNYIGFTLAEQDRDLARALELLTKANDLSPDQAYIIDSLAWAHYKAGNNRDALQLIRKAVGLDATSDAAIWDHYGDIALKEGKKDEARRAWRRALQLKPANAEAVRSKLSKI